MLNLGFGLLLTSFLGQAALAQDTASPRLQIGVRLLPAIIAANQSLRLPEGDSLPIYLVYREDPRPAEQMEPALARIGAIRGHPLALTGLPLEDLLTTSPAPMSVIFITEPMGDQLNILVDFSKRHRLLIFSPFKADVERGVATGFRVTDKILPMVNMNYLKETNIQLKAFFLRIAVKHE